MSHQPVCMISKGVNPSAFVRWPLRSPPKSLRSAEKNSKVLKTNPKPQRNQTPLRILDRTSYFLGSPLHSMVCGNLQGLHPLNQIELKKSHYFAGKPLLLLQTPYRTGSTPLWVRALFGTCSNSCKIQVCWVYLASMTYKYMMCRTAASINHYMPYMSQISGASLVAVSAATGGWTRPPSLSKACPADSPGGPSSWTVTNPAWDEGHGFPVEQVKCR